jgi:hypothetical protein
MGEHLGVGVHAGVTVDKGDASGRERLLRYTARPALSLTRIHFEDDGRIRIDFKKPWRNGATAIRLTPEAFVLRLANLLMPAGVNLVRFHGVFGPASPLRSRVTPKPSKDSAEEQPRSGWILWKILFKRVFGRAADSCPSCGKPMTRMGTLLGYGRAFAVFEWIVKHGNLAASPSLQPP